MAPLPLDATTPRHDLLAHVTKIFPSIHFCKLLVDVKQSRLFYHRHQQKVLSSHVVTHRRY